MSLLVVLLFLPLISAVITFVSGGRFARYVALAGGTITFVLCNFLKPAFVNGGFLPITYFENWITNPVINFSLSLDGLSFMLVALTTFLVPLIIFTTYSKQIENAK